MAEGDVRIYGNGIEDLWSGSDITGDTIKCALVTGYTFSHAHDFWDDASASEESGTGYTTGGETIGSWTVTFTEADSWGTSWAASTAYSVGDVVKPVSGNGYIYRCYTAGTSAGSEPTWSTTVGDTNADNTVEWVVWGRGVVIADCANPSWAGLDVGTPGAAIFYKDTGTPATSPLYFHLELGSTASNGGTYTITIDATYGIYAQAIV